MLGRGKKTDRTFCFAWIQMVINSRLFTLNCEIATNSVDFFRVL